MRNKRKNFFEKLTKEDDAHLEASLLSSIVWSFVFLNLSVFVSVLLVYLLNPTNSIIYIGSYLALCMISMAVILSAAKSKLGFGNSIILSLLVWLMMGWVYFILQEYLNFYHWKYEVVKNISVKEVSNYPNASAFYFNDGKLLIEKHHSSYYITGGEESSGSVTSYLIPFVPNNWIENDTVRVFLYGEENNQYEYMVPFNYSNFYEELKQPHKAGIVLRVPEGTELYFEKIKAAEKEQQLTISQHPFVLKWVEDPEKYVKQYFRDGLYSLIYFNLGWIIFVIIRRLYFAYKRSAQGYATKKQR